MIKDFPAIKILHYKSIYGVVCSGFIQIPRGLPGIDTLPRNSLFGVARSQDALNDMVRLVRAIIDMPNAGCAEVWKQTVVACNTASGGFSIEVKR